MRLFRVCSMHATGPSHPGTGLVRRRVLSVYPAALPQKKEKNRNAPAYNNCWVCHLDRGRGVSFEPSSDLVMADRLLAGEPSSEEFLSPLPSEVPLGAAIPVTTPSTGPPLPWERGREFPLSPYAWSKKREKEWNPKKQKEITRQARKKKAERGED